MMKDMPKDMGQHDDSGKGGMKMMSGAEAEAMCKKMADEGMSMMDMGDGKKMPVQHRKAM